MTFTTTGSILRSNQAYCGMLCERHTLDFGVAFVCDRFPMHPEVNQFREVILPKPAQAEMVFESAETFFAGRGLRCHRWATADGLRIEPLAAYLKKQGFVEREYLCLTLVRWTYVEPSREVRVLPARAMRAAFEATFTGMGCGATEAAVEREIGVARLDEASLDMFVALKNGKPAGRMALYQVGDIGRVIEPVVVSGVDEARVEKALLAHVISLAQRLQMRTICLPLAREQHERLARFREAGFEVDGSVFEYHRAVTDAGVKRRSI